MYLVELLTRARMRLQQMYLLLSGWGKIHRASVLDDAATRQVCKMTIRRCSREASAYCEMKEKQVVCHVLKALGRPSRHLPFTAVVGRSPRLRQTGTFGWQVRTRNT